MRIYSQTSVDVDDRRTYGGGHIIVSMLPTETPDVEKVNDLVHVRAKGSFAGHLTLSFRSDDATRSVLRRVLAAMGTEAMRNVVATSQGRVYQPAETTVQVVNQPTTSLSTGPVCDHCGEPVEMSPGGLYWTHTIERSHGVSRFACIINGMMATTDATVNGSEQYPADLVPDPS